MAKSGAGLLCGLAGALVAALLPTGVRAAPSGVPPLIPVVRPSATPTGLPSPQAKGSSSVIRPDLILAAYRSAVGDLTMPANIVFQYTQTRQGPRRVITESHRVYRISIGSERNETTMINGVAVSPVIVRVFRRAKWPYSVDRFLVSGDLYDAVFSGATTLAGRRVFGFDTKRATPADFAVTHLYLDRSRLLPVRELFNVSGGGCTGQGAVSFAPAGAYWLPSSVEVACTAAAGEQTERRFRESIRFFGWQFPKTIPRQVFGALSMRGITDG